METGLEEEKYQDDTIGHHQHHTVGSALDDTTNHSQGDMGRQEGYNQEGFNQGGFNKGHLNQGGGYPFAGFAHSNNHHAPSSRAHMHRLQTDDSDYPPPPPLSPDITAEMASMQGSLQQQQQQQQQHLSFPDNNVDDFGEMEKILRTSEAQGLGQGLGT